ncbi:hypothetical protein [Anaerotignum sp.]|uniref:hypothetical protein n=1 Tax=Anaerotignum sp. TaxID=2039241 RepID=UPI0027152A54|nr:hypothetical protein [Anaerotignum sp.]
MHINKSSPNRFFKDDMSVMFNGLVEALYNCKMSLPFRGTKAEIPRGWQLCDGTNDTDDMREQFVRCASDDSQVGTTKDSSTAQPQSGNFRIPEYKHSHTLLNTSNGTTLDTVTNVDNRKGLHVHGSISEGKGYTDDAYADGTTNNNYYPYVTGATWGTFPFNSFSGTSYKLPCLPYNYTVSSSRLQHRHKIDSANSEHQHQINLASTKTNETTLAEHDTAGGDSETAPQHIYMYWIAYTGERAPNWNA